MRTLTYNPQDYNIFIGIDVHKNNFSFTIKDKNIMNISKTIPANAENLYKYISNNFSDKNILCTYEAGPTGFKLYDYLNSKNIRCLIVSPLSLLSSKNDKVKTDKRDSQKLAQQLRNGDIMSIRVPEGNYRELRHLVRIREEYSSQLTHAKQKIKGLLLYESLHTKIKEDSSYWSSRYILSIKQISSSEAVKIRLDHLIHNLEFFRQQLLISTKTLRQFTKKDENINRNIIFLTSIPGIGFITATTLLGNIGDPNLLQNPSSMLIEVAWASIRKDIALNQFFNRIKSKNFSSSGSRKAIVAVARKLTLIIYRILKDQRNYILIKNNKNC